METVHFSHINTSTEVPVTSTYTTSSTYVVMLLNVSSVFVLIAPSPTYRAMYKYHV